MTLSSWGLLCLQNMEASMMHWGVNSNSSEMVLFGVHAHQAKQGRAGAGSGQGHGRGRAKHSWKPQRTSQIRANQDEHCALGPTGSFPQNPLHILTVVTSRHLEKQNIQVTCTPTFQNLTDVDTGICKHDTKGYCHDAHQDTKHGFQAAHAKPIYQ